MQGEVVNGELQKRVGYDTNAVVSPPVVGVARRL